MESNFHMQSNFHMHYGVRIPGKHLYGKKPMHLFKSSFFWNSLEIKQTWYKLCWKKQCFLLIITIFMLLVYVIWVGSGFACIVLYFIWVWQRVWSAAPPPPPFRNFLDPVLWGEPSGKSSHSLSSTYQYKLLVNFSTTRLQEALYEDYLYRASNLKSTITLLGLSFIAESISGTH